MQNKTIPELDKLFLEIGTYRKGTEFMELLEFVKKFPHIAPYNAMLVHVQKPGSQYVCSASEWRSKYYRDIKPGARPLVILRPFGPVAFVFELFDTDGRPFPKELTFEIEGDVSDDNFNNIISNLKCDGISYNEADHGVSSAGFTQISQSKREQTIIRKKKEIQVEIRVKVLYDLVVNRNYSREIKFATILHEIGHIYCGHLGTPHEKWWHARSDLDRNIKEFEAESICWLVCGRLGIKNPSARYLIGYLNSNEEIPYISIDTVLKAAGAIESLLRPGKEPRKEIVVNS